MALSLQTRTLALASGCRGLSGGPIGSSGGLHFYKWSAESSSFESRPEFEPLSNLSSCQKWRNRRYTVERLQTKQSGQPMPEAKASRQAVFRMLPSKGWCGSHGPIYVGKFKTFRVACIYSCFVRSAPGEVTYQRDLSVVLSAPLRRA